MRFILLTLSHRQPAWVDAAFEDYAKRMPREARIDLQVLKPETRPESAGAAAVDRLLEKEAQRVLAAIPAGARVIALDERGQAWSTKTLARSMEGWFQDGRDVVWVVGSADGLHASLLARADQQVSLSGLTLPHGLVRVVLAEQLYRALSLLRGHPYHRE